MLKLDQLSQKNSCQTFQIPLFSSSIAPHGAGANRFCPVKQVKTTIKQHRRNQMKFNKWTLGLAAVGVVSLASAARADETPKISQMQTALSNTTISGYVDVSAQFTPQSGSTQPGGNGGYGNAATAPNYYYGNAANSIN